MHIRLLLRRLVDGAIVLLLVITAWRILAIRSQPLADPPAVTSDAPALKSGDLIRLPGVHWSAPRTVVLVVSSTCPSCNANLPLYRQLVPLATPDTQLIVVSTQPTTVIADWLGHNQGDMTTIHRIADPLSHGLTLTPMVLIVDRKGRVTDVMIRKLNEADQERVLERVRNPAAMPLDNSQQLREISMPDLERINSHEQIQLLDVRSRDQFREGHRVGARNIPASELRARAPIELDSGSPVVVDCLQAKGAGCRGAGWTLLDSGFSDVSLLITPGRATAATR